MRPRYSRVLPLIVAWVALSPSAHRPVFGQDPTPSSVAVPRRVDPWMDSKIKGSPDPPLPYQATRVFSKVVLDQPTEVRWVPSAKKWLATTRGSKVVAFANDPVHATATPLLDMNDAYADGVLNVHGIIFHPDLENQPWCFVTFVTKRKDPNGVILGRLRVIDPTIPTFDTSSLQVLASWSSIGHVGMAMQFGPDGMLYVTIGDGQRPYPPDGENTGQDRSDLQSSILRIDVNNPTPEQPYRIPPDNPFVGQPNVRGEIWAFGFRNPWKIAFDPISGDLLASDVGWESREMIHRVAKGRNHGWSIMEGSQPVKQELQPEIPITPPLFEHTRRDSRSISGGHFWQSDRIEELKGAYIYGDWITGKVWALKHKGDQVLWQQELVDTPLQIISFMLDPTGEVLVLSYDGTILRLDPNTEASDPTPFPTRLSETGLFADVVKQQPSRGVVEYQISSPHWADGTHSQQWIAVPESQRVGLYKKDDYRIASNPGRIRFPENTVLAKTVSYLTDVNDPGSERRIETQLLHRYLDDWRAYNYVWNEDQTDAILQEDVGIDRKLVITDPAAPGGSRSQTWRHAARSECLQCHAWGVGGVHAFWPEQLNIPTGDGNQLQQLTRLGLFDEPIPAKPPLPSLHDSAHTLEKRARAYLELNCATCHRKLGGGTANFNFDLTKSLDENNYIDQPPAQGSFGLDDARIVAPGDPLRSVLIYRTLKSGRGHMPQIGSNVTDMRGIKMLYDWIASMPGDDQTGSGIQAEVDGLVSHSDPEQKVRSLLSSTSGAMALSMLCSDATVKADLKTTIINLGIENEDPLIRDLFEHYLPEERRVKRLGPSVDADALLAQEGSIKRGRELFEDAKDINCRACHRIGSVGKQVGPDLSGIGTQQRPDEILASILNPSQKIDPKFRTRTILTVDGTLFSGIVVKETQKEVGLVDATGKAITLATDDIEDMQPSAKSTMPDQLLSGMTSEQAADLLAFLSAQRKIGPLQHKHATIVRTKGPIEVDGIPDESAWQTAAPVGDFVFTWWNEGDAEKQTTEARMLWDDQNLYVTFQCADKDIQATRVERDDAVYRDDCVEVFASPEFERPERYFNLEMNALGTQLDEYRPQGEKTGWNPDGIKVAVSIDGTINDDRDVDRGWTLEVAIPFKLFKHVLHKGRPEPGDRWRLNLNRLDREMQVKSQWSQGDRNFPRFHHPEYFGFVEFAD